MRNLSLLLLLPACLSVCRVSAQVADSVEIARFWNEYYELALNNGDCSDYWLSKQNLIERPIKDMIFHERYLPHKIGRITALSDSVYVITLLTNSRAPQDWYKVGVLRREEGYKLVDYFQLIKDDLNPVETRYIDLYSLKRKASHGKRLDRFVGELCEFYGFEPDGRIGYLVGSDLEACFHAAGIGFSNNWGIMHQKGYTFFGTLIFTGKKYHAHEIVHTVMAPRYPQAPPVLHEGLAIYHSKARRGRYSRVFQRHVDHHAESSVGQMDYFSLSGAGYLLIDHTMKNYGKDKVLALLSCTDLDEALEKELGVAPGRSYEFLVSLLRK
jgi:hypothetical protein